MIWKPILELLNITYRSRATTGRSRLVAAPLRGRSQTTFTDFWPFLTSLPPWLTALLDKIC